MTTTAVKTPLQKSMRSPEEVALQRLRMLGMGVIAAVVVVDALHAPLTRWRAFRVRIIEGLDPLDRRGTWLVEIVSDLLSNSEGAR